MMSVGLNYWQGKSVPSISHLTVLTIRSNHMCIPRSYTGRGRSCIAFSIRSPLPFRLPSRVQSCLGHGWILLPRHCSSYGRHYLEWSFNYSRRILHGYSDTMHLREAVLRDAQPHSYIFGYHCSRAHRYGLLPIGILHYLLMKSQECSYISLCLSQFFGSDHQKSRSSSRLSRWFCHLWLLDCSSFA